MKRTWSWRALPARRILIWAAGVFAAVALVIVAAYQFDIVTESSQFCGLLCHPNRPQYETHQISAHANMECGTCHVGPGLAPKLMAHVYGISELVSFVTNSYQRPVQVVSSRLRPASEICEQCHWPNKDFDDQVRRVPHFASDQQNTESITYLLARIGPSSGPQQSSIHWHVDNPVYYAATDAAKQDIPWVAVEKDGKLVEYVAKNTTLTTQELAKLPSQQMDCLDCHNRATHQFDKPERRLDADLADGTIDQTLPFVKREGLRLLSASYATQAEGVAAMKQLTEFYRSQYPAVYAAKGQAIAAAVTELQTIYQQTTFPDMNITWQSYPDDAQHADSAGCFRCHDGQHVSAQGDVIPFSCTLCHSVPVVVHEGQQADVNQLASFVMPAARPSSHQQASFVRDHSSLVDGSCASCHGKIEYGTDNSSFCANEACHVRAGWSLPANVQLEEPPKTAHRVQEELDCLACHSAGSSEPVPASHKAIPGDECLTCHQEGQVAATTPIPHEVDGRGDCLACHAENRLRPVPADHKGWPNDTCLLCHDQG